MIYIIYLVISRKSTLYSFLHVQLLIFIGGKKDKTYKLQVFAIDEIGQISVYITIK